MTGSNRRPSRCKLQAPTANCGLLAKLSAYFPNLCRFRFAIVPVMCTLVHIGRQRDWYSRAALTAACLRAIAESKK